MPGGAMQSPSEWLLVTPFLKNVLFSSVENLFLQTSGLVVERLVSFNK
jgi:hypothetical protein